MMNENLRCETPDLRGDEREMIVLHPDLRRGLRSERLLVDRFRESRIDLLIALPVLAMKLEMLDEQVAQRPQRGVREPEVIPLDVVLAEPDTTKRVPWLEGWDTKAADFVGSFAVGRA